MFNLPKDWKSIVTSNIIEVENKIKQEQEQQKSTLCGAKCD